MSASSSSGDHLTQFGFTYGPAIVQRLCHIEGKGRVLEVYTDHARVQLHITEAGRKINVSELAPYEPRCKVCDHFVDDCICDFVRDEWPTHFANPDRVEG